MYPLWSNSVIFGVYFSDSDNGTIVGNNNSRPIVMRTTDGGSTWEEQLFESHFNLNGVYFTDSNNGTAVGNSGTILRTTNGGITSVKEENLSNISSEFTISQNYPNPFNPTTTIKYSVSKQSIVAIKVYDVLGREIETLVNDEKSTGNYKVEFDASKLTSGIYFYRMQAGDFVETKKIILMK
jgi:hypothetical protein